MMRALVSVFQIKEGKASLIQKEDGWIGSFVFTPNQLGEMKRRDKVILRGVNRVSILSANKLKV